MNQILQEISIDTILPNPEQPRVDFDEHELQSLATSIQENGVIQPIVVEESGDYYLLHDGERRWRAAQLAGLAMIPAVVSLPLNGTGQAARMMRAFVANMQRADLNPMEQARALGRMRDELGLSVQKIAQRVGWPNNMVQSRLDLLALDSEIQGLVARGDFPRDARSTRALLSIEDREVRVKLAQKLARPGITIKAIVKASERIQEQLAQRAAADEGAGAPSLRLAGAAVAKEKPTPWRNVRASAQGLCATCSSNPGLPSLPEPAWSIVMEKANGMCAECSMASMARAGNLTVCQECPAVDLLRRLVST